MTHREHHVALRAAVDELLTDYLLHHPQARRVRGVSAQHLLDWAVREAAEPTDPPPGTPQHNDAMFSQGDPD